MTQKKYMIIDRVVCDEDVRVNGRTFEILERYDKISDIITRTHAAMGKSKTIRATTASTGSDKILVYAPPSTH